MGIFTFNKYFFSKRVHLLSQIVTFNQLFIKHVYQTYETSINKINICRS